jgi:hypothetical protein
MKFGIRFSDMGIRSIVLMGVMVWASTSVCGMATRYKYSASQGGKPVYKMDYSVTKPSGPKGDVHLSTKIIGEGRNEDIQVVLRANHQFKSLSQVTKNKKDRFKWRVTAKNMKAAASWTDLKSKENKTFSFDFPKNGYPIQVFIYMLQQPEFKSQSADLQLLVPPNGFYGIAVKTLGDETINVRNKSIPCHQVEVGLSGVIGAIGPKYMFWIDSKTGVPVRYLDGDVVVDLVSAR